MRDRTASSPRAAPLDGDGVSAQPGGFSSHRCTFTIPGPPVAWARARTRGGLFFTAPKQRQSKTSIAWTARAAMGRRSPFCGAIVLTVRAFFAIPKSWPKWMQREAIEGRRHPTGKPDWDNLGKQLGDALNGVVWIDDAQVVGGSVHKHYDAEARTEVEVYEVITEEVIR